MTDFSAAIQGVALPAVYLATFVMAFASGIVPFVINTELCLAAVAVTTHAPAPVVVAVAATGQMLAKYTLYLAGRGTVSFKWVRQERRAKAEAAFERHRRHALALVGVSAVTGIPPFYGVSLVAGAVRLHALSFVAIGTVGRLVRFTVVYLAPAWLHALG